MEYRGFRAQCRFGRRVAAPLAAICLGLLACGVSAAQTWSPTKPVRIIVPYPPGGTSDLMARLLAPGLGEALGQPVVIENRSGGAGVAGTDAAVRAAPDGHTLGLIASSHASSVTLVPDLPYDPIADVQPLTLLTRVGVALVTHPAYEAKTLPDLIRMAKEAPGKIPYGSAGFGLSGHFAGEAMKLAAGVDMTHVPYRGGAPGLNDVIAGQIPMMFNVISSVLPAVQSGKVRPLALATDERSPLMPEVPTMSEAGLANVQSYEWYGLIAPAGVPAEAVKRLHTEIVAVLKSPAFSERMGAQGIEVFTTTPDEFGAFIRSEVTRFRDLVADANIKVD